RPTSVSAKVEEAAQKVRIYSALADVEARDGRSEEAEKVLREGLEKMPDQAQLEWQLILLLMHQAQRDQAKQRNQLAEAEKRIDSLAKKGLSPARQSYLRAALQSRRGNWPAAQKELMSMPPLATEAKQMTLQRDLLLAECFDQLGDQAAAVLACRRVL